MKNSRLFIGQYSRKELWKSIYRKNYKIRTSARRPFQSSNRYSSGTPILKSYSLA
jgi:hypothetical protein